MTRPVELAHPSISPPSLEARYKGKRVLITGGMGFIGSTLGIRLAQWGAQVTILDSMLPGFGGNLFNIALVQDQVRVDRSDLRDRPALDKLVDNQEILFNLAAQVSHVGSMKDPFLDLDINARGQLNLLEACRARNPTIRLVHVSSRQVYGRAQYLPVDEKHPLSPLDIYSINKLAGEAYHRLYGMVHRLRVCVLRLTTTYGPRQNGLDFIGVFMRRAVSQQPLLVYGEGAQQRDFVYVDDVCHALLLAGAHHQELCGETYNVGAPSHCSIREFADRLGQLAGVAVERVPFPPERAAIEVGDFYTDDTKFRQATGWTPRVELEDGLERTLRYFSAYREHYLH